jgi:hypothetical protein
MMKRILQWALVSWMGLGAGHALAANGVIEGYVPKITVKQVEIEGRVYPLVRGHSEDMKSTAGRETECWAQYRTTCGTLAGVGYIDKARVTIRNGYAMKIEVLELQQ